MNDYQKAAVSNFVQSGALSTLLESLDKKHYNLFKLSIDNPKVLDDTINMIRGLKALESEIQNVMNELEDEG
ncbi:hypothetical protein TacPo2_73 [Pantoea bacteriophage TacPo2]